MSLELLSLGIDALGGIFGASNASKNRSLQRQQMAMADRQFNQQMDESVQRRVKDAKQAGVHPLFALGASVGASPTVSASAEPQGSPMQSALTAMARSLGVIEQNRASAKRDEAEAALLDSERKRIEQSLNSEGQDAGALKEVEVTRKLRSDLGAVGPAKYYNPEVPTSSRMGVQSGVHPGKIEYVDEQGHKWTLPSQDLGLDEINQVVYAAQEVERYGRLTRRKLEQIYQDVLQKRRRQNRRRQKDITYDVAP